MHKIALSTLKSALDFNNKLYENSHLLKKKQPIMVTSFITKSIFLKIFLRKELLQNIYLFFI